MAFSVYDQPCLNFGRRVYSAIDFPEFRALWMRKLSERFPVSKTWLDHGPTNLLEPDRDNLLTCKMYSRAVYTHFEFQSGERLMVLDHNEESEQNNFLKSFQYNLHTFNISFLGTKNWPWVLECVKFFREFLAPFSYVDRTFGSEFGMNFYEFFRQAGDHQALKDIHDLAEQSTLEEITRDGLTYLNVRCLPFLDINSLLHSVPQKEKINTVVISQNNLNTLPDALFEFKSIHTLDISQNTIEFADPRLSAFTDLRYFSIHGCPFTANPTEMNLLRQLLPPTCKI
jgi:hypothetical protein